MTEAHDQNLTFNVIAHIPEHAPREHDEHYHLFDAAKKRIKKAGLWVCAINDDLCGGQMELHHSHIEYSQINNIDPARVEKYFGLHFEDEDDFYEFIHGPGNLEVLCTNHHRTHFGVHVIPAPLWEALRFRKIGSAPAVEVAPKKAKNKKNGIIKEGKRLSNDTEPPTTNA